MEYIYNWFYQKFLEVKDKIAIIHKDQKYTYGDLTDKINEFNKLVQSQIPKGEVVALLSDYSFYSIALFFSLIQNKNIIVPVISITKSEIENKIDVSIAKKKIAIVNDQLQIIDTTRSSTDPLYEKLRKLDHAGLILFSSGITGEPKAMVHDLDVLVDSYKKDVVKEINSIIFLTFDHIGGIDTLFSLLSIGGTITIPESRDPESVCALIERNKVDVLSCSPTFLNLLILSEAFKMYNLSSLRIIGFGAERMPEFLYQRLKEIFPAVRFQQKFGTSETNAIRVKNHPADNLYMRIEDPNIQFKIVDNELWLKSSTQILGYLNTNADNFEEGWFKTGDIVDTYEDRYFRIIGRKKEIINVGGEKVFPGEVENIILQLKCITGCTVYGLKNIITGESVVAEVAVKQGFGATEVKNQIREICTQRLDAYKRPSRIKIVESISFNERFKKIRRM